MAVTVCALGGPTPGGGIKNESPTAFSSPVVAFPQRGLISGGGPPCPKPAGKWHWRIGAQTVPGAPHMNTSPIVVGWLGTIEIVCPSFVVFCQVTESPFFTDSGPGSKRKSAEMNALGIKRSVPLIVTVLATSALLSTTDVVRATSADAVRTKSLLICFPLLCFPLLRSRSPHR